VNSLELIVSEKLALQKDQAKATVFWNEQQPERASFMDKSVIQELK